MQLSKLVRSVGLAVTMLAMAGATQTASAQSNIPQERKGFWINAGLGFGSFGCEDCDSRETALSGQFSLGGTISSRFQLGAMTNGWTKSESGVTLTTGALSAIAKFYPKAEGGLYLLGGLGVASIEAKIDGFGSDDETGSSAVIGIGYDLRVKKNLSVTPYFNAVGMGFDSGNANVAQFGVALTWH